jgi:vacuolar-type H+-ATPase subunit F/Vma7
VALIFHAYESPNDETVTGETMEKAIAFIKSYVIPSMRYCYCSSLGDHEQYILDIFTSLIGFQETVSLSELKRTGSNKFKDYKPDDTIRIINDTMQILENKEWVVNVVDTRQSKIWAINPALVESCKDNRKRILIARQRALEDTKEAIREAHNAEKFPRVLIKGYSTEWDSEL